MCPHMPNNGKGGEYTRKAWNNYVHSGPVIWKRSSPNANAIMPSCLANITDLTSISSRFKIVFTVLTMLMIKKNSIATGALVGVKHTHPLQ